MAGRLVMTVGLLVCLVYIGGSFSALGKSRLVGLVWRIFSFVG